MGSTYPSGSDFYLIFHFSFLCRPISFPVCNEECYFYSDESFIFIFIEPWPLSFISSPVLLFCTVNRCLKGQPPEAATSSSPLCKKKKKKTPRQHRCHSQHPKACGQPKAPVHRRQITLKGKEEPIWSRGGAWSKGERKFKKWRRKNWLDDLEDKGMPGRGGGGGGGEFSCQREILAVRAPTWVCSTNQAMK